jgi:hypothetical protein
MDEHRVAAVQACDHLDFRTAVMLPLLRSVVHLGLIVYNCSPNQCTRRLPKREPSKLRLQSVESNHHAEKVGAVFSVAVMGLTSRAIISGYSPTILRNAGRFSSQQRRRVALPGWHAGVPRRADPRQRTGGEGEEKLPDRPETCHGQVTKLARSAAPSADFSSLRVHARTPGSLDSGPSSPCSRHADETPQFGTTSAIIRRRERPLPPCDVFNGNLRS